MKQISDDDYEKVQYLLGFVNNIAEMVLDPEEYLDYGVKCILTNEEITRALYEAWKADPEAEEDIKLLCHYPVHENETEEEAFERALNTTESEKEDQGGKKHG